MSHFNSFESIARTGSFYSPCTLYHILFDDESNVGGDGDDDGDDNDGDDGEARDRCLPC